MCMCVYMPSTYLFLWTIHSNSQTTCLIQRLRGLYTSILRPIPLIQRFERLHVYVCMYVYMPLPYLLLWTIHLISQTMCWFEDYEDYTFLFEGPHTSFIALTACMCWYVCENVCLLHIFLCEAHTPFHSACMCRYMCVFVCLWHISLCEAHTPFHRLCVNLKTIRTRHVYFKGHTTHWTPVCVCMYVCVYMESQTSCASPCLYTRTRVCTCTCTQLIQRLYVYVYMCACIWSLTHVCAYIWSLVYMESRVYGVSCDILHETPYTRHIHVDYVSIERL